LHSQVKTLTITEQLIGEMLV